MPELIETHLAQLNSLPLPSAALVIDLRGMQDDDVIERLRVEIADLASEMQAYEINHWRYLTKFLSFRIIAPLSSEQIKAVQKRQKPANNQSMPLPPQAEPPREQGLIGGGSVEFSNNVVGPFQLSDSDPEAPFDTFRQSIEELVLEIDRVRRNRIVAFQDLPRSGAAGQARRDPTVRVIFITDANIPESLASAAVYAVHIKDRFQKRARPGQQVLVNTSVLCLDSHTEEGASARLIEGLGWDDKWDHFDSLIVNEQYNEEGALLTGSVQTYHAELILYMLLLIPPFDLSLDAQQSGRDGQTNLAPPTDAAGQPIQGYYKSLPPTTFNVGMATIEHSARWGRRWINYSLAVFTMKMLQDKAAEGPHELDEIRTTMANWLKNWRGQIAAAIPDKVPGNIPALKAIPDAERAATPLEEVFPDHRPSLKTRATSERSVEEHHKRLLALYTAPSGQLDTPPFTLQAAANSVPAIEQRLRDWEERDPAFKKGTPLVNAQSEAHNILGRNISLSKGAVPRARAQLLQLSSSIAEFQRAHDQDKLDLEERRERLAQEGQKLLGDLKKHGEQFPLLASVFQFKNVMAWATFLLSFLLVLFATLLGLAWTAHLLIAANVLPSSTLPIIFGILEPSSVLATLFWLIVVLLIIAGVFIFGRSLVRSTREAFRVEFVFTLTLVLFFVCNLVLSFSVTGLAGDSASQNILLLFSPWFFIGVILLIVAILIAFTEIIYFYIWHNGLLEERAKAIEQINRQHLQNVEDVKTHIADTIALQLLMRTGLTDGEGGPGSYYQRVAQLYAQLNKILTRAEKQQKLASRRLGSSMTQTQPAMTTSRTRSDGEWLRVRTREEHLEIPTLVDGYKRWEEFLEKDPEQLKHFTELLLRMMGEEVPIQIEQQFREKTPLRNYEQQQARTLLETLVSIILRFALAPTSIGSLTTITDRYESLNDGYLRELPIIGTLIQSLSRQISQVTIAPVPDEDMDGVKNTEEDRVQLATDAFATWGQVLWDHQDGKLDSCLSHRGILAKLTADPEYDPMAVMRQIGVRVALFANGLRVGQRGDAYLMLAPSDQSRRFRQSLNIDSTKIRVTEFPDNERLLLFYIQRYVASPIFVAGQGQAVISAPTGSTLALPVGSSNQTANADTTSQQATSNAPDGVAPVQPAGNPDLVPGTSINPADESDTPATGTSTTP